MKSTQQELLKALTGQSPDGGEQVIREHLGWMLPLAKRLLVDVELAEMATRNVFTSIFKNPDQLQEVEDLIGLMRRKTIEEAVNLLPGLNEIGDDTIKGLMPEFDKNGCRIEEHWPNFKDPKEILSDPGTRKQILREIEKLPDRYRVIILLRDIEELTISEVSETLNFSIRDVKVSLYKARAALKKLLEPFLKGGAL
ncbi:MAG: RNA polymerase sigma factor [Rhizobiaceae bacterium]